MQHRIRVLGGAFVMAWLLAIGLVPATAAQQDVCVSVDGVEIYQYGSADCASEEGNTAIAVGDGSFAEGADGKGNSAIAVGEDSFSRIFRGDNNTGITVGDFIRTVIEDGDDNTGINLTSEPATRLHIDEEDNCFVVALGEPEAEEDDCFHFDF